MKNLTKSYKLLIKLITIGVFWFVIALMTSCAGVKKYSNHQTSEKISTEVVKDTTKTTKTNGAIKDNIVINVPKSDNAETMRLFNEMMSKMNTSKSSGSNSYRSVWDKENMQWLIEFVVAETKNKSLETTNNTKIEKSFDQQIDEYIKKIVVPWWMYILVGLLVWRLFGPILIHIINPIFTAVKKLTMK